MYQDTYCTITRRLSNRSQNRRISFGVNIRGGLRLYSNLVAYFEGAPI